ncbi:Hsp70 protein-domain-containing protein [Xylaria bambusicola]|uniref:Hsp70 protein-domain-containing protein n=1 Tax=Xylaria bambusicola TaxID=326684 RepID=UPI002007A844|nr:Hsp70 protein-domain-containing protein [Xylaria bambusicola]KAI0523826.1 Hsp70 protein-domain-containing protein [Xylaria bambusicola]
MQPTRRGLRGGIEVSILLALALLFCPVAASCGCHRTESNRTVAIGIDIGNVYSRVAYGRNMSSFHIAPDEQGHTFIPSCVAFTEDGPLVGYAARRWAISHPETMICNPRALLGRQWSDPDVQDFIKRLPYEVSSGDQDQPMFKLNVGGEEKIYAPEEVASLIIGELKIMAEASMGNNGTVTEVVITVPNYFTYEQRRAVMQAGELAGVEVIRVLNNPIAISMAYDNDYGSDYAPEGRNILVVDVGDTIDVAVLRYEDGYFETLDMSQEEIGRDILDQRFARYLLGDWEGKIGEEFLMGVMSAIYKSLKDAELNSTDIDDVILAGGIGQVPEIVETISREFPGKKLYKDLRAEAIVLGAARHGAFMTLYDDISFEPYIPDFSPLDLGIETVDGYMAVVAPQNVVPFSTTFNISTAFNKQSTLLIKVLQGQRVLAADNRVIGELEIPVTPGPASIPRVEVLFQVTSQAVRVTATDLETGKSEQIIIDIDPSLQVCQSWEELDLSKAFCNWPDWNKESAEYNIDKPELRADVDARFDLENYITALSERLSNPEKWGVEDVLKYYASGHPTTLTDVSNIFEFEWVDLVVDREIWELKDVDEVKTLKQWFLRLTELYFGAFEYEFIPKVGGKSWIRHDEL